MKTTMYLIRHGETEANLSNTYVGHTDVLLTEKGRLQAKTAAEYLKNIHADFIYSSDLSRAFETALYTASLKGMKVIKDVRFREMYGGKWENLKIEDIAKKYPEGYDTWCNDVGRLHCADGESVGDVQERIVSALTDIAEKHIGKTIFVFCHAAVIRFTSAKLYGMTPEETKALPWASNASSTVIEYENGKFTVKAYGYDKYMGKLATYVNF